MKKVAFAKRWINRVNATTTEEYPAGWSGQISDGRAERAAAAGVLKGAAEADKPGSSGGPGEADQPPA